MSELFQLSLTDLVQGIAQGRFNAADVVRSCLSRIADRDGAIGAWIAVRDQAQDLSFEPYGPEKPLAGIPFGVKDIIDVAGMPTQMGSALYEGYRPLYDSGVVGQLRGAGAVPLGKTATCEFAGTQPALTRHPIDPDFSPGGSSSGSAAAVADFMVPFALGTQTGGSVLRPASFCGIVGFKPTYGFYPISGVRSAAPSFDTVGLLTRSVEDAAAVHAVLMNEPVALPSSGTPRIGLFRSHLDGTVSDGVQSALSAVLKMAERAGARIVEVAMPAGFDSITEQRAVINAFERAHGHAGEWLAGSQRMGPKTRHVLSQGLGIKGSDYVSARKDVERFRGLAEQSMAEIDIIVTPTVPGPAPRGLDNTGDPRLQELWTMLHMPSLSLPMASEALLPVGLQVVAVRFNDQRLLGAASWLEGQIRGQ